MDTMAILNGPFNAVIHKKYFHDYLEVIIDAEGIVHYAVPSHSEWLIKRACEKLSLHREELFDKCPPEYYFDVIDWLTKITDCVAVWDNSFTGHLNEHQYNTLKYLESEKLFTFPLERHIGLSSDVSSLVRLFTGLDDVSEYGYLIYEAGYNLEYKMLLASGLIKDSRCNFLCAATASGQILQQFDSSKMPEIHTVYKEYVNLCADILKPEYL